MESAVVTTKKQPVQVKTEKTLKVNAAKVDITVKAIKSKAPSSKRSASTKKGGSAAKGRATRSAASAKKSAASEKSLRRAQSIKKAASARSLKKAKATTSAAKVKSASKGKQAATVVASAKSAVVKKEPGVTRITQQSAPTAIGKAKVAAKPA